MEQGFPEQRKRILEQLYHDPKKFAATLYSLVKSGRFWRRQLEIFSPYLQTDLESICCLVKRSTERELEGKPTICIYSKVREVESGKEGTVYHVTPPDDYRGPDFVLKVLRLDSPRISYLSEAPTSIKYIQQMIKQDILSSCMYPDLVDLNFLASDSFTNEYLIGYILNEVYARSELKGVIGFNVATICHTEDSRLGVTSLEYASFGNLIEFAKQPVVTKLTEYLDVKGNRVRLETFDHKVILGILKQIVANLDFLHRNVQFNHGDLKPANILVSSAPSRVTYQGLSWDTGFTIKFADFTKSSLTIKVNDKPLRLFNQSSAADAYLLAVPFKPVMGYFMNEPYYTLDSVLTATALAKIRHMGIPFYFSFDTYTSVVGSLLMPEFYYPVMTNETYRRVIWDNLWFPDDYSEMWNRLNLYLGKSDYDTIVTMLRGIKLKCRINEILMEGLRTL